MEKETHMDMESLPTVLNRMINTLPQTSTTSLNFLKKTKLFLERYTPEEDSGCNGIRYRTSIIKVFWNQTSFRFKHENV